MVSFKSTILPLACVSLASSMALGASVSSSTLTTDGLPSAPPPGNRSKSLCGKLNFHFVGLPPGHPITNGTVDPWFIYNDIRRGAKAYRDAGYNVKVLLFGPETPLSVLEPDLASTAWHATGVGYGIRGSQREDLSNRLEDTVQIYRRVAPRAPLLFNAGAADFTSLQRFLPIGEDCGGKPGADLGFKTICDICSIPADA